MTTCRGHQSSAIDYGFFGLRRYKCSESPQGDEVSISWKSRVTLVAEHRALNQRPRALARFEPDNTQRARRARRQSNISAFNHRRFKEEPAVFIRSHSPTVCLLVLCTCLHSVGCTGSHRRRWFSSAKPPVAQEASDADESSATETKVAEDESRYRLASHRTDGAVDDLSRLASEAAEASWSVAEE